MGQTVGSEMLRALDVLIHVEDSCSRYAAGTQKEQRDLHTALLKIGQNQRTKFPKMTFSSHKIN